MKKVSEKMTKKEISKQEMKELKGGAFLEKDEETYDGGELKEVTVEAKAGVR